MVAVAGYWRWSRRSRLFHSGFAIAHETTNEIAIPPKGGTQSSPCPPLLLANMINAITEPPQKLRAMVRQARLLLGARMEPSIADARMAARMATTTTRIFASSAI